MTALKVNGGGDIELSPTWKWLAVTVVGLCVLGATAFFSMVSARLEAIQNATTSIREDLREVKTDIDWMKRAMEERARQIQENRDRIRDLERKPRG